MYSLFVTHTKHTRGQGTSPAAPRVRERVWESNRKGGEIISIQSDNSNWSPCFCSAFSCTYRYRRPRSRRDPCQSTCPSGHWSIPGQQQHIHRQRTGMRKRTHCRESTSARAWSTGSTPGVTQPWRLRGQWPGMRYRGSSLMVLLFVVGRMRRM